MSAVPAAGRRSIVFAVHPESAVEIIGIDPTAPYVALAQSSRQQPHPFRGLDARQMRSAAATFDHTLLLLVLNFIPDVRKALGDMKRVTKPGGKIAAAVWDGGDGMDMLRVFW
jgi:ubiquinone/menaquinone biosynthesis C-methylase UbiE